MKSMVPGAYTYSQPSLIQVLDQSTCPDNARPQNIILIAVARDESLGFDAAKIAHSLP